MTKHSIRSQHSQERPGGESLSISLWMITRMISFVPCGIASLCRAHSLRKWQVTCPHGVPSFVAGVRHSAAHTTATWVISINQQSQPELANTAAAEAFSPPRCCAHASPSCAAQWGTLLGTCTGVQLMMVYVAAPFQQEIRIQQYAHTACQMPCTKAQASTQSTICIQPCQLLAQLPLLPATIHVSVQGCDIS